MLNSQISTLNVDFKEESHRFRDELNELKDDNKGYKEEIEAKNKQLLQKEGEHAELFSIFQKECEEEKSDLKSQLI